MSPRRFRALARAKVNLSLEVLRRRPDGYHEIESILQSIDLHDELDIGLSRDGRIAITSDDPEIPTGKSNICHRAICALRSHAGSSLGATIHIRKRIPHSAGLGGGSADAAAVLLATRAGMVPDLPMDELERVGAEVGSDVPFMLHGGTMLARGRGERLTPLTALGGGVFVIVKPSVDISTSDVYRRVTFGLTRPRYRINLKAVNALLSRFPRVSLTFRNALEDVVCPAHPLIAELLEELLAWQPRFASMSGSGSALYAIVEDESTALEMAERFSVRGFFTAVAQPSPRSVELQAV